MSLLRLMVLITLKAKVRKPAGANPEQHAPTVRTHEFAGSGAARCQWRDFKRSRYPPFLYRCPD